MKQVWKETIVVLRWKGLSPGGNQGLSPPAVTCSMWSVCDLSTPLGWYLLHRNGRITPTSGKCVAPNRSLPSRNVQSCFWNHTEIVGLLMNSPEKRVMTYYSIISQRGKEAYQVPGNSFTEWVEILMCLSPHSKTYFSFSFPQFLIFPYLANQHSFSLCLSVVDSTNENG